MSKQDTHFFNVFSLVIGLLVAVAIGLFALARIVASRTQDLQVLTEADYSRNVDARIHPLAQEAIAGRDNSALAIQTAQGAAAGTAVAAAMPKNGTELFEQTCSACHGQGVAGAPSPRVPAPASSPRAAASRPRPLRTSVARRRP